MDDPARRYLVHVDKAYRRLKFRGLPRHRAEGIEPPELEKVYVSLHLAAVVERGESEEMMGRKTRRGGAENPLERMGGGQPVALPEALQLSHKLALIGPAGCGKSTLLQWAGLACARARLNLKLTPEQRAFVEAVDGKDHGKSAPFPLLVPLRAFDEHCQKNECRRTPQALLGFIAATFGEALCSEDYTAEFFSAQLKQGALLMFDGVDEIDPDHRPLVRAAIEGLLQQYDHTRLYCLVASRPSAAAIPDQMADFRRCDVQRLAPDERDHLIRLWYQAVLPENAPEARRKALDLCTRLAASERRVQELATTPLMTTIFAMVHYSRDELPRHRARLYEEAVQILLTEVTFKEGEHTAGLQNWQGWDWETRRDRLARIAFELHARNLETLPERDLTALIWPRFGTQEGPARIQAARFLQDVANRGGLLEESDGRYGFFTHRTFQEFLAGRYLVEGCPPGERQDFLADHLTDDHWEEPIRLAAGYLAVGGENEANRFVRALAEMGRTPLESAHALALAGFALSDLPQQRRLPENVQYFQAQLQTQIEANPPSLPAPLRARLGLALGEVGDPRIHPGAAPAVIPIPAGRYRLGSNASDEAKLKAAGVDENYIYDDEKTGQRDLIVTLGEYALGQYPVTNAEYRAFVDSGGYGEPGGPQPDWWSADGWKWRTGKWDSGEAWNKRTVEERGQPYWWHDPKWNAANLPVVGVCWFEAEAYCCWLRQITGQPYRLPTEAEWECAARGPEARLWPWGDAFDPARCNTADPATQNALGRTSPIGIYPHGNTTTGLSDMVGNVWEWCGDWFAEDQYARLLENPTANPTGPASGRARALRGGAWDLHRSYARCCYRSWNVPDFFSLSVGFRVACAPNVT